MKWISLDINGEIHRVSIEEGNFTFHVQCDKLFKEQIPKSSLDKGKSLVLNMSGNVFTLTKPKEITFSITCITSYNIIHL